MSFSKEVEKTLKLIAPFIRETPCLLSPWCSKQTGAEVHLKLELLQFTGAFKIRGALSKVMSLSKTDLNRGFAVFSMGNHGLGVSYAAKKLGSTAKIFLPDTTSEIKQESIRFWGGEVILAGPDFASAKQEAVECANREGRILIHPFDDEDVIRGQGTLGYEILNSLPDVDAVVVPIGGGGLISGIARYIREKKSSAKIYGVETLGSEAMLKSLEAGALITLPKVTSIADSIALKSAAERTFNYTRQFVEKVVAVSDDEAVSALVDLLKREKVFCEPAASCTYAAALGPLKSELEGKKVVLVLSGGNFPIEKIAHQLAALTMRVLKR